jgi:octaprenyl-diphosphate synthase
LELAAVVEFIHTATLLHDDVIDESELRRGRGTANSRFGNAASVLVGDFLYSRAFQMMLVARSMRVMEVLADATNAIAEGEVLQLMNIHNLKMTETEYLGVIRRKTAKLFQAATQLGAILGSAPSERERELAEYGMHLGTAFQLIDDVLDYSGDAASVGKTVGVDLVEGKVTLPLIFILREGDADQICQIQSAMRVGGRGDFSGVRMLLETSGALEYARHVARKEAALARDAISSLPNSEYKESLLELAAFSVERNH